MHVSDKKAHVFSYRQMDDGRKKFSPQNGISMKKVSVLFHCSPEYYIQLSSLESLIKLIGRMIKKEDTLLQGRTLAVAEDTVRLYGKIVIKIAVYMQIIAFIKYSIGRMKAWGEKMKN